jgi:hypothetical protein
MTHPFRSHPLIHPRGSGLWLPSDNVNNSCESEPTLFTGYDGKLKEACGLSPSFNLFRVRHFPSGADFGGSIEWTGGGFINMPTVFPVGSALHMLAMDGLATPNNLRHYTLTNPSYAPVPASTPVAYTPPGTDRVFNCGVTFTGSEYIAALEINSSRVEFIGSTNPGVVAWTPRFAPWTPPGGYIGAVNLKYTPNNGAFYLKYLIEPDPTHWPGVYCTTIAKSTNPASGFTPWAGKPGLPANFYLLAPDLPGLTVNASDEDMNDDSGVTQVAFIGGNQSTVKDIYTAMFNGTQAQLLQDFMP